MRSAQNLRWMWSTFPINAASIVFTTVLPLYVLSIGGNVLNITDMFAVYNLVYIPFSPLWGVAIDRLRRRRFFFALSFSASALVFLAMFLVPSIPILFLLVALFGVAITASGPISSLLVMETADREGWYDSLGRLYLIANLGSAMGLLVGLFWPGSVHVSYLLLFCSASSLASVALTYMFVKDPIVATVAPIESNASVRPYDIGGRLRLIVKVSVGLLSRDGMRRLETTIKAGVVQARSLLFFSSTTYMVAYAILNMSYVAFLSSRGVSDSLVFGIIFSNMVLQLVGFASVSRTAARLTNSRLGLYSIMVTGVAYFLIGLTAIFMSGWGFLLSNLVLFSASGLGFALWTGSSTRALYSNLGSQGQAGVLGSYGALVGLGTVVGSAVSGVISFYVGYSSTFVVAGVVLLPALELLKRAFALMRGSS